MASVAQSLPQMFAPLTWLREFLKQELRPYPGRAATVGRMVIAATLVMVVGMTFRIPYIFQGAVYTLLITRESPRATLRSSVTILFFTLLSAAYVLITVGFVISSPLLHFLWVVVTFFIGFYVLTTTNNYGVASTFAVVISIAVPLWARHVPAETNVEDTLWLTLSTCLGIVATAAIELIFVRFSPGDEIVAPIAVRLAAVESLLACYAENRPVDEEVTKKLLGLGIRGTSRLRRTLRRSDYPSGYRAQMNSVAAAVGRLVDLAATLTELSPRPSARDQQRLRNLVSGLENVRADLENRRIPRPIQTSAPDEGSEMPLLCEMEETAMLIPQAFAGTDSIDADLLRAPSGSNLLSADAFTNPEPSQVRIARLRRGECLLHFLQLRRLARHQHGGNHLSPDCSFYHRILTPEAGPALYGRGGRRLRARNGFTNFHPAVYRLHRRVYRALRRSHRNRRLVYDLQPSLVIFRVTAVGGVLPY